MEQEGTYKLPEAQLDRFVMKINVGYPSPQEELEVLTRHHGNSGFTRLDDLHAVLTVEELLQMRKLTSQVIIDPSLMNYIVQIVQATRTNRYLFLGASPRASVSLMQTAKGLALLQGRDFVTPDDIQLLAFPVLRHRLMLNTDADLEGLTVEKVIKEIISQIEVPK